MVGVVGVVGVEIVAYGWDRLEYGIDHLVGVWGRGGRGRGRNWFVGWT